MNILRRLLQQGEPYEVNFLKTKRGERDDYV